MVLLDGFSMDDISRKEKKILGPKKFAKRCLLSGDDEVECAYI
jgi:hypothetical protein